MDIRIGNGFDVHAFADNRKLILGGIEIPYIQGLLGHSDADVLLHSISDALLGSLSLGDIGKFFPDSDLKYKNINSMLILKEVHSLIKKKGYKIVNIDNIIMCEKPKLANYILDMRKNIAKNLKIKLDQISIKATTTEGMGSIGRREGIAVLTDCIISC